MRNVPAPEMSALGKNESQTPNSTSAKRVHVLRPLSISHCHPLHRQREVACESIERAGHEADLHRLSATRAIVVFMTPMANLRGPTADRTRGGANLCGQDDLAGEVGNQRK